MGKNQKISWAVMAEWAADVLQYTAVFSFKCIYIVCDCYLYWWFVPAGTCCLKINLHKGIAAIGHSTLVKNVKLFWSAQAYQTSCQYQRYIWRHDFSPWSWWNAGKCFFFFFFTTMFFMSYEFPVYIILFTLLPLPFFTDGGGDVAISVSSLHRGFVSDQSHGRNRKRRTLCKQIELFLESPFCREDAARVSTGTQTLIWHVVVSFPSFDQFDTLKWEQVTKLE